VIQVALEELYRTYYRPKFKKSLQRKFFQEIVALKFQVLEKLSQCVIKYTHQKEQKILLSACKHQKNLKKMFLADFLRIFDKLLHFFILFSMVTNRKQNILES
jgi:hypothetical protein